jgi:hypothetical protein
MASATQHGIESKGARRHRAPEGFQPFPQGSENPVETTPIAIVPQPLLHAYDGFLARLARGPIPISDSLSAHDGEARCDGCGEVGCAGCSDCGPSLGVTRTVLRLEYAGYRYGDHYRRLAPYVREVLSCGHTQDTAVGTYPWKRPRRTSVCGECSAAISWYGPEHVEGGVQ